MMAEVAERHVATLAARRARSPCLPSMQAITLEVIMRAVFGVDDPARRERIGAPLRRLLDTRRQPPRACWCWRSPRGRTGPRSPWARFAALRARGRRAALRGDPRPPRRPGRRRGRRHLLAAARGARRGRRAADRRRAARRADDPARRRPRDDGDRAGLGARAARPHARGARQRLLEQERAAADEYLDAVIKETLRLRPVVPAVVRRLQAPMELRRLGAARGRPHRPLDLPAAPPARPLPASRSRSAPSASSATTRPAPTSGSRSAAASAAASARASRCSR